MPSINYETIYKRALTRINDLELATYTQDDFYEHLKEWLHTASSSVICPSSTVPHMPQYPNISPSSSATKYVLSFEVNELLNDL